jgi:hypothetical protein
MVVFLHSWSSVLCLLLRVCGRRFVMFCAVLILLLKTLLHLMESYPNFTHIFFFSSQLPNWLCGPPSLLSNRNRELLSRGWSGLCVKPISQLHLVLRIRMSGDVPLVLTHIFMAWRLFMNRDNLVLSFLPLSFLDPKDHVPHPYTTGTFTVRFWCCRKQRWL